MTKLLSFLAAPLLACAAFAAPAPRDVCADPRPSKDELLQIVRAQAPGGPQDLKGELAGGVSIGKKTKKIVLSDDGRDLKTFLSGSGFDANWSTKKEDIDDVLGPICRRRQEAARTAAADAQRRAEYERQNKAYEEAEKRYRASQGRQDDARRRTGQVSGGEAPASPEAPPTPTAAPAEDKCAKLCAAWAQGCDEAPNADNCRPLRNIGRANNCSCVD